MLNKILEYSGIAQVPEVYKSEFVLRRTTLLRYRLNVCCLATLAIYYAVEILYLVRVPDYFSVSEFYNMAFLLAGVAAVLFLNSRFAGRVNPRTLGYAFTTLMLIVLCLLAVIRIEHAMLMVFYFAIFLFFDSLIMPWTPGEVFILSLMHFAAYSAFYAYARLILHYPIPILPRFHPYVDGMIFLCVVSAMCMVTRKQEMDRSAKSFMMVKEIEETRRQMQSELELAGRVHQTLIPKSVVTENAEIAVSYLPMSAVGGDYAKFHFLGRERLLFMMSDVTGHGVPAALMVNRLHSEFERLAKEGPAPGMLLKELDDFVSSDFAGTNIYLSAFCGDLDFESGRLRYSNHGHPAQLIYHLRRGEIRPLKSQTTLLGIGEKKDVHEEEVQFETGDRIFLFTDGVIEATNAAGELFGGQRLELFFRENSYLPVEQFNRELLQELKQFKSGSRVDDIFLLSIQIL